MNAAHALGAATGVAAGIGMGIGVMRWTAARDASADASAQKRFEADTAAYPEKREAAMEYLKQLDEGTGKSGAIRRDEHGAPVAVTLRDHFGEMSQYLDEERPEPDGVTRSTSSIGRSDSSDITLSVDPEPREPRPARSFGTRFGVAALGMTAVLTGMRLAQPKWVFGAGSHGIAEVARSTGTKFAGAGLAAMGAAMTVSMMVAEFMD